jgi:hypothetical protein
MGNIYLFSFCQMSDSDLDSDSDSSSVEEHQNLLLIKLRASNLNFKDLPPLEKTYSEIIAQIAGSSNKVLLRETAFKNLYCFVACMSCLLEHISTECNMRNLWLLAFGNFGKGLNFYHLKDASSRILSLFPNHNCWPQLFQKYCVGKKMDPLKSVQKKLI